MTGEIYYDKHGQPRRFGLLEADPQLVKAAFPLTFEAKFKVWSAADIKAALQDPNRKCGRKRWGKECIRNQGGHGSCNGWAGATGLSKARAIRGFDWISLSGSYVYSWINGNRDAGSALVDGMQELGARGAPPEDLVPWNLIYRSQMPPNADAEAAKHKGLLCLPVESKEGMDTAVAMGAPVIVCVQAGRGFETLDSNGVAGIDYGSGNHAIHVDDARINARGDLEYDSANQWGLGYGDNGRAWQSWKAFERPFQIHTFYAVFSTEEKA